MQQHEVYYDIVDHCNGLLCVLLCSKEIMNWKAVVVWNPSTKEQKRLRAPDQRSLEKIEQHFGFSYDSTSDDYKVVLVTTFENIPAKIQCLGLKMDSWEIAQNDIHYLFDCDTFSSSYAAHVNGYIYWAIKKRRVDDNNGADDIASLDLGRNRMIEETSLSEMLLSGRRYVSLHPLKESLFMIETDDHVNFNAWIMKENDEVTGTKSWIKFFQISIEQNVFNPVRYPPIEEDCISPICFTGNGNCLMVAEERQDFFFI
ncbi:hypothetical protein SLEP1_g38913 [Rubroshorea leprosula]|uniref:F-box associated beta-propeller type 1 domain-containing protein n=1 Tax=Rubroshorea leprosula TaxID=152421 RepID=A0AAV5KYU0_9ROSI|nr:hypothetical protein SLEP1_g38913 [Rubroshorea leprosula]